MVYTKSKQAESVLDQINSVQQNIDTLKKQLHEITNQLEANRKKESEEIHYLKSELTDAKLSLDARAKQEDEVNILLIAVKNKAKELNRELKDEMFRYEATAVKNKELTTSIQMLEQQLTVLLDENKTRNEKEACRLATINKLHENVNALEDEFYFAKLMNNILKAEINIKNGQIIVSEINNSEMSSLVESGNRKIAKLEVSVKEMNEKLTSKETNMTQMQIALEKAESKASSLAFEAVVVEDELVQVRASLLSSILKQDELKSEILNIEAKVQQEAVLAKQLSMQLEMERKGKESAKEAEKKALQVIATQERRLALLKSGSSHSEANADVQLLKYHAEEKDRHAPEVHLLHKKIKQLEYDKEFLKELCKRRHKQREDLKKELAALSGQSTSKAQPENKENVNLNA